VPARFPLAGRALLAALAVALGALAVVRLGEDRACARAGRDAFAVGIGRAPATAATEAARAVRAHCAGTPVLAASSSAFLRAGAVGPAGEMARLAVAQLPEDHRAWSARAAALAARGDRRGAARARARARALNPRAPRPRAAGRPAPAP
jgi:Flp pilus assembly protein TadD